MGKFSPFDGITMRISADARKCVVFFGIETKKGIEYGGTGFLIADFEEELQLGFLVTCRHVAQLLGKYDQFFLRVNTKNGGSFPLPIERAVWAYHPDSTVDLAAMPLMLPGNLFDAIYQSISDKNHIVDTSDPLEVEAGDHVSIIGLFRLHTGKGRNVPFVHSGTIAVLADPSELIPIRDRTTNQIVQSEVFLVEVQTLDGLSGSPVFMHEVVELEYGLGRGKNPKAVCSAKFFGVYTGAWDGEPGAILAADRNLRGGTRVPIGVGTVVAFSKVLEIVREHPKMKKHRADLLTQSREAHAATQDAALPAPPATDANPNHREGFTALLNAAARTPPQDD